MPYICYIDEAGCTTLLPSAETDIARLFASIWVKGIGKAIDSRAIYTTPIQARTLQDNKK